MSGFIKAEIHGNSVRHTRQWDKSVYIENRAEQKVTSGNYRTIFTDIGRRIGILSVRNDR